MEQRDARLRLDARLVEADERLLEQTASRGEVVGRGGDGAETSKRTPFAERVVKLAEQFACARGHLGATPEVGEPVGEMTAAKEGFRAQTGRGIDRGDEARQPLHTFGRAAPEPVVAQAGGNIQPSGGDAGVA